MTDTPSGPAAEAVGDSGVDAAAPEVAHGELVDHAPERVGAVEPVAVGAEGADGERREAVEEPAKVMRIGSMVKQLLEEVRSAELDAPARTRLKEIYDTSVQEVGQALSPDLRAELDRVAIPFGEEGEPTDAELRVAQAQLVGWLEGLFHGIQAAMFAQQMMARNQAGDMGRQLGPGAGGPEPGPGGPAGPGGAPVDGGGDARSGTYL